MFKVLQHPTKILVALSLLASTTSALADGALVLYGTTGNCATGQYCVASPVTFFGYGGGNGVTGATAQSEVKGHHGHQHHHHGRHDGGMGNGMGYGQGGSGGMGGSGGEGGGKQT